MKMQQMIKGILSLIAEAMATVRFVKQVSTIETKAIIVLW